MINIPGITAMFIRSAYGWRLTVQLPLFGVTISYRAWQFGCAAYSSGVMFHLLPRIWVPEGGKLYWFSTGIDRRWKTDRQLQSEAAYGDAA